MLVKAVRCAGCGSGCAADGVARPSDPRARGVGLPQQNIIVPPSQNCSSAGSLHF
jgi:hypothetical protein